LKSQDAGATKSPQVRERTVQTIDRAKRIKLIYDEPTPLIAFGSIHRLEDRKPHPGGHDVRSAATSLARYGKNSPPPRIHCLTESGSPLFAPPSARGLPHGRSESSAPTEVAVVPTT